MQTNPVNNVPPKPVNMAVFAKAVQKATSACALKELVETLNHKGGVSREDYAQMVAVIGNQAKVLQTKAQTPAEINALTQLVADTLPAVAEKWASGYIPPTAQPASKYLTFADLNSGLSYEQQLAQSGAKASGSAGVDEHGFSYNDSAYGSNSG